VWVTRASPLSSDLQVAYKRAERAVDEKLCSVLANGNVSKWESKKAIFQQENDELESGLLMLLSDLQSDFKTVLSRLDKETTDEELKVIITRFCATLVSCLPFLFLFSSTAPWTPLIMPFCFKVVPKEVLLPKQLDKLRDRRLSLFTARRRRAKQNTTSQ
jgi:hypothetical protein